ncbi:C26 family cysteine hydrolase domain-containing family, partial [Candidatus Woesearchaeota archaeon]|nr:C26 family cysteine hydrolase domain-containing family [Candidatus Woesearchaeota archaeon]
SHYLEKDDYILHSVVIDPVSRAHFVMGCEELEVTSFHHQAVKEGSGKFIVSGRSPGGIVEVIEVPDPHHFCFGVQGHPERMKHSGFDKFFEKMAIAMERSDSSEEVQSESIPSAT